MNPILKMLRKNNDVKTAKFLYQQHVAALEIARLTEENTTIKEQLKEANKVIKKYSDGTIYLFPTWYNGSRLAEAYLKKWGVK